MQIKYIEGNIIDFADSGKFDVMIHGCNCQGAMGSGVAKFISERWPTALQEDRNYHIPVADRQRMGENSYATVTTKAGTSLVIVNAYIQFRYGWGGPHFEMPAFKSCMNKIAEEFKGKRLLIPKIGSLRAGGNWDEISQVIESTLDDVTCAVYRE